jgi:hypothetical protein
MLSFLVIIDFPYGKLVKTMMFNIYQEIPLMVNIKHHGFLPIYHMGNL